VRHEDCLDFVMLTRSRLLLSVAVLAAVTSAALGADRAADGAFPEDYLYSFQPLPEVFESVANSVTPEKVVLGRVLYFDPRLSKNHDVACSSCHDLEAFGVDGKSLSLGHRNQEGTRNSPTVYNAAIHVAQFWDGRSPDVEDQSKQPILNPVEMAMPDEERVLATLRSMPAYVDLFEQAFPGQTPALTYDTMALAIGAFERGLVTPDPFDSFLRGETEALSAEQRRGFERYVALGCASCHNGPALGGGTYEVMGFIEPYPDSSDLGLFELTKAEEDRMRFKVPGLRNIAKTAPYFHDGAIRELAEAVRLMAKHQLGVVLGEDEEQAILVFLDSLTGELPTDYIAKPPLPEKTDATPRPIPE